jgi:predicted RNase H-like nuclease (RuvC/YqgF family)
MKFLKKFFKKKNKEVTVSGFITDIETKLEQFKLTEKTVNKIADRVKELDADIKEFKKRFAEFSEENDRMGEVTQRVIEVVNHIYDMDLRLAQLEKKIAEIQAALGLEEKGAPGELKKKNGQKQITFEL